MTRLVAASAQHAPRVPQSGYFTPPKTQESLPSVQLETFESARIKVVVSGVREHYQVPIAFLALEAPSCLHLKARIGVEASTVPLTSIARHWVARELPIIIEDIDKNGCWKEDELVNGHPKKQFFVGAPLMSSGRKCVGSFVIMDTEPRAFRVQDSKHLVEMSKTIMGIFRSASATCDIWKLSLPSIGELPSSDDLSAKGADTEFGCEALYDIGESDIDANELEEVDWKIAAARGAPDM
mmetsp:Transcript_118068/g.338695  ORF Transcript_118068/g.338695 Transcript_118068/m.338695 type:complete len:239 (-) Transcript_118068:178-894(-)|eukprot:CAMPEP_0170246094 /NCGR_PEP_ID=MMETSP0116_2-20130129/22833_1 /TAXON_ID=400756 /ORGANISM="Durinskia baltica, Strain CSIRO CS-38" /LENGTH=238 /DNA_ID=CAMNT_0010496969 /DNA_START=70 /DNA_END=786 /DNA_ORIENTATION=+